MKPRKVHLATQTVPEPAGTELEGKDNNISRNADRTEDVQNTKRVDQSYFSPLAFPVTAIPVMKANTPEPPNQANQAEDRGEEPILCVCGATCRGQWWELAAV